jgi:hypothetical protein
MHRRSVLFGLITAGIFPGATFAQAPTSSQQAIERATRPYIEFSGSNIVAEDATVVRVWFSPTCRYSYEYQNFFENLARSVPPATGMSVEFSPVLNFDVKKGARDGALWALTYATVRRYYPAYTLNLIKASYVTAQEYNLTPLLIKNVADTLKAARLNPEQVIKTMVDNKANLQNDLNNYAKLMKQYKITSTPRVTVAGVYETNPDYVDGDPKKFEIVINALISMASGR